LSLEPHGALRRFARLFGIGRLLQRLGLASHVRSILQPEDEAPPAPGVLLVGHPYGVTGVAEYLRSSAVALAAAGVPFHIRNTFDWGEHLRDTHTEFGFWDRLTSGRPHPANVFHVNANEMAEARRHLGSRFFAGRYNIACWHWELSRFPDAWLPALQDVDEVWASSRFMRDGFAEKARVPVVWMPHPVDVRGGTGLRRADLALPEDAYLFVSTFDYTSYIARKNPMGAIRAFQSAFPAGSTNRVGLVIKSNGSAERPEEARAFLGSPELRDPRIVVIDRLMERREVIGLFEACDALVSLHRAEGFGRGLAEAMLLGKPVIATAYSGNMDFTREDNACLVDFRLIAVGRDDYPHAEGQVWADPDLAQAAAYMRRLVADPAWSAALAEKGRDFVAAQHGPAAVGERYRARLAELGVL
jgi:glycosyltransferase involved in cell wall biosynthesis